MENIGRRAELAADQPRPHPPELGNPSEHRKIPNLSGGKTRPARRDLYDLTVTAAGEASASSATRGAVPVTPAADTAPRSKEDKLRELKRFHDQGLITDDVYVDRQKAILSEP